MQIAVPMLCYYHLQNQTFKPDYHSGGILYTLDLEDIHVKSLSTSFEKKFEMLPGNDHQIHLRFSGIDVDLAVEGGMKLLHFIPMSASGLTLTNITIDFTLESKTGADGVHWSLVDASYFHFDTMTLSMKNWLLTKLVKWNQERITGMVLAEMPKVSAMIDHKVLQFNGEVANENDFTFVMPV